MNHYYMDYDGETFVIVWKSDRAPSEYAYEKSDGQRINIQDDGNLARSYSPSKNSVVIHPRALGEKARAFISSKK